MLHDLRITAEQLHAAGEWVADNRGENFAAVELLADDRMLLISQGDDRAAFDTDGSPGSDEYLAAAPLDRATSPHPLRQLHEHLFPERYIGGDTYEWHAGTIEDVAAMIDRLATEHNVPINRIVA